MFLQRHNPSSVTNVQPGSLKGVRVRFPEFVADLLVKADFWLNIIDILPTQYAKGDIFKLM